MPESRLARYTFFVFFLIFVWAAWEALARDLGRILTPTSGRGNAVRFGTATRDTLNISTLLESISCLRRENKLQVPESRLAPDIFLQVKAQNVN